MRASSANQTSIDRALSLLVMTGTSRELTISHGAQFPALTETIKRELRRRSAVEPVIGHAKAEHRMGRNYLVGTQGDAANAVLATAGYNFRRGL
jgi:IS5 family transposase